MMEQIQGKASAAALSPSSALFMYRALAVLCAAGPTGRDQWLRASASLQKVGFIYSIVITCLKFI